MMYQDEQTAAPTLPPSKKMADKEEKLIKLEQLLDYQFDQAEKAQLMRVPASLIRTLGDRVKLLTDRIRVSSGS